MCQESSLQIRNTPDRCSKIYSTNYRRVINLTLKSDHQIMSVQLSTPIHTCPYVRLDGTVTQVEFYVLDGDRPSVIGSGIGIPQTNAFYIVRGWMRGSSRFFNLLSSTLQWNETYIKMGDKVIKSPRLVNFMGDLRADQSRVHNYSSYANPIQPWEINCSNVRDRIRAETSLTYDSALLNYYKTGDDYIAWHGDREVRGLLQSVATVSLGATRRFYVRENSTKSTIKVHLNCGDLVIMTGNLQQTHKHIIPKQKGVRPRISITLRQLID